MNAARSYLNAQSHEDMRGKVGLVSCAVVALVIFFNKNVANTLQVFVSAGLGGMSGAQPKAGKVAGMIAVIAEADGR